MCLLTCNSTVSILIDLANHTKSPDFSLKELGERERNLSKFIIEIINGIQTLRRFVFCRKSSALSLYFIRQSEAEHRAENRFFRATDDEIHIKTHRYLLYSHTREISPRTYIRELSFALRLCRKTYLSHQYIHMCIRVLCICM